MRHIAQVELNASTYFVEDGNTGTTNPINTALCPITTLLNYSCQPNAILVELSQNKQCKLIKATRPIRAGEELFLDFDKIDLKLVNQKCACKHCVAKERDQVEPDLVYYPIGCLCGSLLIRLDTEWSDPFYCHSCNIELPVPQMKTRHQEIGKLLSQINQLLSSIEALADNNDNPNDGFFDTTDNLDQLEKLINKLKQILHMDSILLSNLFQRLARAYLIGINCSPHAGQLIRKALTYTKDVMTIWQRRHQSYECLELCSFLRSMTDLFEAAMEHEDVRRDVRTEIQEVIKQGKDLELKFNGDTL